MSGRVARRHILYDGCYAHVISRSIRKLRIFADAKDLEAFRKLLIFEKGRSKFKVYHYCLMQTHFHLAVQMPDVNEFSRSMARVKSQYASAYHTKYRLSGPIWRERFKSLLVENEGYLFACGKYIETNPVRAGLVEKEGDWLYSSYKFYNDHGMDTLVDGYEDWKKLKHAGVEAGMNAEDFEKGNIVGSPFFKFQFYEQRKRD